MKRKRLWLDFAGLASWEKRYPAGQAGKYLHGSDGRCVRAVMVGTFGFRQMLWRPPAVLWTMEITRMRTGAEAGDPVFASFYLKMPPSAPCHSPDNRMPYNFKSSRRADHLAESAALKSIILAKSSSDHFGTEIALFGNTTRRIPQNLTILSEFRHHHHPQPAH